MGGIFQGDIFIKLAIELGLEDMRKNPFLIDHMYEDLKLNRYAREKYGEKQIEACKEWLLNNQIDVYVRPRDDKDHLPCVTIELGESVEKNEMKLMADQSTEYSILMPNKIGKPIPFFVKPFIPAGYNEATGDVAVPDNVNIDNVQPGMILVNPDTGVGYVIQGLSQDGVLIEPGQEIDASQLAIVPRFPYYKARIEHSFFEENYIISANAHGDPQNVMFLWSIVKYSILRYRESLLEANGFAESSVSSGGPDLNQAWSTSGGEKAYSRVLTLNGQIENTWVKAPHRYIEAVSFEPRKKCKGLKGGIKIFSNLDTAGIIDQSDEVWTTVVDREDPDDDDTGE
jgi:hypothetical protein